jgi:hypothetical protein
LVVGWHDHTNEGRDGHHSQALSFPFAYSGQFIFICFDGSPLPPRETSDVSYAAIGAPGALNGVTIIAAFALPRELLCHATGGHSV